MKTIIFLIILSILGWFLLTFRITDAPPGINGDEATLGLSVYLISQTGHDSEGRFLPIFTKIGAVPDWKHPVTVYITALIFKIFGPSLFTLRATSVIFTLISIWIIYYLLKELVDGKTAFIGVLLFIATPIVMIQSHLAHENIAPIPFVSFWLLMVIKYTKKQNQKLLLFAGISLGLSIFTYFGMRIISPVLIVLTLLYVYYLKNKNGVKYINHIKWFILGLFPAIVILLIAKLYYPGSVLGLYRPYKIGDYQSLILPFISAFDPSFLYINGDSTPYHSTGKHGMFLLATLPLFIFGMVDIIRNKKPIRVFILISFFLIPFLFGLASTVHRASRLLVLVPSYIAISAIGFNAIRAFKWKIVNRAILIVIFFLISLNFIDFVSDYWFDYPQRVNQSFEKPVHNVFKRVEGIAKKENLKVFIHDDIILRRPSAYIFFANAYLTNRWEKWEENSTDLPKNSIVLVTDQVFQRSIKGKEGLDISENGDMDIYVVINRSK